MKRKSFYIVPAIIFLISFFYRFRGLTLNTPFWVDEFSSAVQAQLILERGLAVFYNSDIKIDHHNITSYSLIALSFKLFGQHEWSARLPFAVIGSLLPVFIYLLSKKIYGMRVALSASLFSIFSYFLIVWARQARGYVLLQVCVVLAMWLYFKLIEKQKFSIFLRVSLVLVFFIGIFTHSLFFLLLASLAVHFFVFHRNMLRLVFRSIWLYILIILCVLLSVQTGILRAIQNSYPDGIPLVNNVWYYHSFLWREYGLFTFFSLIGLIIGFRQYKREMSLFSIYIFANLIFVSYIFGPYNSRYLLPIFPVIFILSSSAIVAISDLVLKKWDMKSGNILYPIFPFVIIFFIIGNGHKFATKPKQFYSVNHDFREIALLDYHQVYGLIKKRGRLEDKKTAVIDTWPARTAWYLGSEYAPTYIFQWSKPIVINGIVNNTEFTVNKNGEKIITDLNVKLVSELSDLHKVLTTYPHGFIFIDDSSLPQDVQNFVNTHFAIELYLERYPLDDNPYSQWPATLYSWGITE